jgi:hypothetical protein
MKITLTVTDLEGVQRDVVAGFSHQVAYEKYTGKSITGWKQQPPGIYDFAVLAWTVETRQGTPFERWTDSVEMVMFTGWEDTNPTKPGASPG